MPIEQPLSILKSAEGFFDLGDYEHAWELLEDLPTEAKASKEVLHLRLQILLRLKEWQNAGFMAESLIQCAEPDNGQLWYDLAVALAQQGKIEEAKQALKKAVELDESLKMRALEDDLLAKVW